MRLQFSIPILLLVLSFTIPIQSQTFLNLMKNTGTEQYEIDSISKITFTDSSMSLNGNHLLSDIQSITFSETGVGIISKKSSGKKKKNILPIQVTGGFLRLSLPSIDQNTKISILNLRGRAVKEINTRTHTENLEINISSLSTGTYLIKTKINNKSYISKINIIK